MAISSGIALATSVSINAQSGARVADCARASVSGQAVRWSIGLTLIVGACIFSLNFVVPDGSIVRGDGLAYFLYARSIVLDGDTDLTPEWAEMQRDFPGPDDLKVAVLTFSRRAPQTGKVTVPWPIGAGVVMAPFYAIGYAAEFGLASLQGRTPNSYGVVVQYIYGLGSVLFGLLAFWTTVACCLRVTSAPAAYVGSLASLLAGPGVYYTFFSPAMAHAPSLALVGLLTWQWLRQWQEETRGVFWLGLLVGMLTFIRYQNVIFGILVAVLIARDTGRHGLRVGLRETAIAAAGALIPIALQATHYIVTNGWSVGYRPEGADGLMVLNHARFDLLGPPQFLAVLFSCDKGAFYWAPMMAFGVVGLVYGARHHAWARVMLAVFLANLVLINAIRNDGDRLDMMTSFGMRYFAECSIGLAMGFAALVGKAQAAQVRRRWIPLAAALCIWNLLLILAFVLTIPRTGCVTYPEMARGMGRAVLQVSTLFHGR